MKAGKMGFVQADVMADWMVCLQVGQKENGLADVRVVEMALKV